MDRTDSKIDTPETHAGSLDVHALPETIGVLTAMRTRSEDLVQGNTADASPAEQSPRHTPTPWRVFTNPHGTKLVGIGGEDGQGILDAGFGVWAWQDAEGIANAELVVKAVNNHAALVKALEATCGYLLNAKIDLETGCPKATAIRTIEGGLKLARAALAGAK